MAETTTSGVETTETTEVEQKEQGKTFTQAEVDAFVKARAERLAKQLYPDYDDLKTKAAGATTLEERLGNLEAELSTTKADNLRTRIAAKYGISAEKGANGEPSDADLFLTGADEAALTAQASRLAEQVADRKKQGNVAPKEGVTTTSGGTDDATREFAAQLFGNTD